MDFDYISNFWVLNGVEKKLALKILSKIGLFQEKYPWKEMEISTSLTSSTYRKSTGIIQLSSFLLLLTAAGLYYSSTFRNDVTRTYPSGIILPPEALMEPPADDWLFDLPDFQYELNSVDVCGTDDVPFFIAVVHSKPEHFRQRQVIRKTWASADRWLIRTVFLLGTPVINRNPSNDSN